MHERIAVVTENGRGPFGADVRVGPHQMHADEPVALGGLGAGPDPYEYLLAGLGACTTMTIRLYAQRKGLSLDRVEVSVRHVPATASAPDVFERVIRLEGDLDGAARERLLEIADRCPVSRTLSRGGEVRSRLDNATGVLLEPGA